MFRRLPESQGNVLGYETSGKLSEAENNQILEDMRRTIADHGKVRVLLKADKVPHAELSALNERLKFTKEHTGDIERYAIVTESKRLEWLGKISGAVTSMEVRQFKPD
jgi:hypothetical protein